MARRSKTRVLISPHQWLSVAAARLDVIARAMASDDEDARMQHLCDEFEELCRQLRYHQKEYVLVATIRGPNLPGVFQ